MFFSLEKLSLVHDVEPEEYVDYISPSHGLRLFVHSPTDDLWLTDQYLAPAGHNTHIDVSQASRVHRLKDTCNNQYDYSRSVSIISFFFVSCCC